MTFEDRQWMLVREDPDFRQRFVADVETDRIGGRWEMSEDQGHTWRKDFDLIFERVTRATTRRKALEGVGRRIGTQYHRDVRPPLRSLHTTMFAPGLSGGKLGVPAAVSLR
jgi:hypothetical protein